MLNIKKTSIFFLINIFIILQFSFYSHTAVAAAPGMHIYTAKLWLKKHPQHQDFKEDDFLIGTLFPDIRFLWPIFRNETHEQNITIQDMSLIKSPFAAGIRIHSITDKIESKFAKEYGIYAVMPEMSMYDKKTLLKFVEDEIIWHKQDLTNTKIYLKKVYQEELASGIPLTIVYRWHYSLYHYFKHQPSISIVKYAATNKTKTKLEPQKTQDFMILIKSLAADPKFITYTDALLDKFEQEFNRDITIKHST